MRNVTISDQKVSLHPIFDHFFMFFQGLQIFRDRGGRAGTIWGGVGGTSRGGGHRPPPWVVSNHGFGFFFKKALSNGQILPPWHLILVSHRSLKVPFLPLERPRITLEHIIRVIPVFKNNFGYFECLSTHLRKEVRIVPNHVTLLRNSAYFF